MVGKEMRKFYPSKKKEKKKEKNEIKEKIRSDIVR